MRVVMEMGLESARRGGAADAPQSPLGPTLATLGDRDEPEAGRMLARCFRDNPMNVAVIGSDPGRRMRLNRYGMRASLAAARSGARRLALRLPARAGDPGELAGVLVGFEDGHRHPHPPSLGAQLRCLLGQGPRVMRAWARVQHTLQGAPIDEPHSRLGVLGVRVGRQSQGFGRSLLASWLSEVDARGLPSYVETDREACLGFYAAAGFETIRCVEVLGVMVWCMRRPGVEDAREVAPRVGVA